jgi:predicted ATPase
MLDWSYGFLNERDRLVLTRLAVFVGSFTLEAAQAAAGDEALHAFDVAEAVRSLLDKSLLTVCAPGDDGRIYFRLLNITRAYVADKLAQNVEAARVGQRHATQQVQPLEACGGAVSELLFHDLSTGTVHHSIASRAQMAPTLRAPMGIDQPAGTTGSTAGHGSQFAEGARA